MRLCSPANCSGYVCMHNCRQSDEKFRSCLHAWVFCAGMEKARAAHLCRSLQNKALLFSYDMDCLITRNVPFFLTRMCKTKLRACPRFGHHTRLKQKGCLESNELGTLPIERVCGWAFLWRKWKISRQLLFWSDKWGVTWNVEYCSCENLIICTTASEYS